MKAGDLVKIRHSMAPDDFMICLVLSTSFKNLLTAKPEADWVEVLVPGHGRQGFFLASCEKIDHADAV